MKKWTIEIEVQTEDYISTSDMQEVADSGVVRLYSHGGVDVQDDRGRFFTAASNPTACGELGDLLRMLANGEMPPGGVEATVEEIDNGTKASGT